MPSLPELQRQFGAALAGGPVPPMLADEAGRFSIYRNNRVLSLSRVLRAIYPATERVLGKGEFQQMARGFIIRYPPTAPDLALYGEKLAAYLRERGHPEHLTGLAELEWLHHHLPEHEHAPGLSLQTIIPPGTDPLQISFTWHPAAELLYTAFAVDCLQRGEVGFTLSQHRHLLLRARHGRVEQHNLDPETFDFYVALYRGKTLGQATQVLSLGTIDIIATLGQALAWGCFAEMRI